MLGLGPRPRVSLRHGSGVPSVDEEAPPRFSSGAGASNAQSAWLSPAGLRLRRARLRFTKRGDCIRRLSPVSGCRVWGIAVYPIYYSDTYYSDTDHLNTKGSCYPTVEGARSVYVFSHSVSE